MVAARGGVLARALGAGGERNGPASAPTAEGRAGRPRARAAPSRRGGPRRGARARRPRREGRPRASAPRGRSTARPKRRAAPARGAAAPAAGAALVLSGRRLSCGPGGLPSPLTVFEQPPAFAEELPHHGGRARPRRRRGAAARLSLAEMMGGTGRAGCPRGLGVPRRPGLHARPARTGRTKNPMLFHRFCI